MDPTDVDPKNPLAAFVRQIDQVRTVLADLTTHVVEDHMGATPDEINWSHVGSINEVLRQLQEVQRFAGGPRATFQPEIPVNQAGVEPEDHAYDTLDGLKPAEPPIWVIYSANEAATSKEADAGYWSNDDGWVDISSASIYTEKSHGLPFSLGKDAAFARVSEAMKIAMQAGSVTPRSTTSTPPRRRPG